MLVLILFINIYIYWLAINSYTIQLIDPWEIWMKF